MDPQQYNEVISHINSYEDIDLKKLIAEQHAGQDLRNIKFGSYNATQFYQLSNRMIKQFKSEFDDGNYVIFPFQYNYQNEFGNGNLINDFANLLTNIRNKNFPSAVSPLNRLIYYQITNGFWDKSRAHIHSLRGLQVTALEEKLKILSEQLDENLQFFERLKEDTQDKYEELEKFKLNKEQEFTQISINLSLANKETNQISELLNNSISTNEKITALMEKGSEKLYELQEDTEIYDARFKEKQTALSELIDKISTELSEFNDKNDAFKEILSDVESKKAFFDERNRYLTDLIGREVGVSLFETFRQRKSELKPSVNFWTKAVFFMSLITIIGIYAIFSNMFGMLPDEAYLPENPWIIFTLKGLKTLPLFILLYFTVHQYSQERHYKEEYAFKSAVALTIKAYADLILDNTKKDEMILNSVQNVYATPSQQKTKNIYTKLNTKDVTEIIKSVTGPVSEALNKIR